MPRKVKKQSKKRIYKRRKATTTNKNKNKNIIKINVSNTGGSAGGGGSSVIPIPYPTSIGSSMFPTTQPVNIYNTMSRNPFETEYNPPEKAFQQEPLKIQTEEPIRISQKSQTEEPIRISQRSQTEEPEPVKIPYKPEPEKIPYEPEKFKPITAPQKIDFTKPPQLGLGMIEEIKKKQEEEGVPIPIYLTKLKNMEEGIQIPFNSPIASMQEKQSSIPVKRIKNPKVSGGVPLSKTIYKDNEPKRINFNQPQTKNEMDEEKPFQNPLIPSNYNSLKSQLDKAKVLDELKKQQNKNEEKFLNINELQKNKKRVFTPQKNPRAKISRKKIPITIEDYIQPDDYSIPSDTSIQQPTSQVVKTRQPSKIPVRVKKAVSGEGNEDEERERKRLYQKQWREKNPNKVKEYNAKSRTKK